MAKINRRDLIKNLSAVGAFMLPVSAFAGKNEVKREDEIKIATTEIDKDQLELRKKVRFRSRRMIMNNDGNDINFPVDKPVTPELFLNRRTSPLLGSHVDSIFYCDGVNNSYSHTSELTDHPVKNAKAMNTINEFKRLNMDPLSIMISFCRQHNKEIFWSMRMNDAHDTSSKELSQLTKWKAEHPEYLLGKAGEKSRFLNKWSSLDYGKKEVRDRIFETLKDVVSRYDVDGVELDFFRHPVFFRGSYEGGVANGEECNKMTELLIKVRTMCDETGKKRGRPVLMSIRVPDSIGYSKALGLDVITWLKNDLIDLMAAGCYFKMEPWANWARLGREYALPVYAVLEDRRLSTTLKTEQDINIETWRGEALIAWESGVNGIYTFNRFKPHERIFLELGDPDLLRTLPMVKAESYINPEAKGVVSPNTWLKNGSSYLKK